MWRACLALLFASCTPGVESFDAPPCLIDGFVLHQETRGDCALYASFLAEDWALLSSLGWVNPNSKAAFRSIPVYVHDSWGVRCGGEVGAAGCYTSGQRIDVDVSMGALSHEWLHHLDTLTGVPNSLTHSHDGWGLPVTADGGTRLTETLFLSGQQGNEYLDR